MTTQKPEYSEKTVSARRRLLQAFAVGGTAAVVLPEKWVKPVIDAVIVPAHASGSVVRAQGIYSNTGTPVFASGGRGNFLERVTDMLMGSAYAAAPGSCGLANNGCISFMIAALPGTSVAVYAQNAVSYGVIYPNNSIGNVTVGNLSFTNLVATSLTLTGAIVAPNCVTEAFSFPKVSSNSCYNPA